MPGKPKRSPRSPPNSARPFSTSSTDYPGAGATLSNSSQSLYNSSISGSISSNESHQQENQNQGLGQQQNRRRRRPTPSGTDLTAGDREEEQTKLGHLEITEMGGAPDGCLVRSEQLALSGRSGLEHGGGNLLVNAKEHKLPHRVSLMYPNSTMSAFEDEKRARGIEVEELEENSDFGASASVTGSYDDSEGTTKKPHLKGKKRPLDVSKYPLHFRTKRERRKFWTPEELAALLKGVSRYGCGKWVHIKCDPELGEILHQRTTVDIKDKWRTYKRNEQRRQDGKSKKRMDDQESEGRPKRQRRMLTEADEFPGAILSSSSNSSSANALYGITAMQASQLTSGVPPMIMGSAIYDRDFANDEAVVAPIISPINLASSELSGMQYSYQQPQLHIEPTTSPSQNWTVKLQLLHPENFTAEMAACRDKEEVHMINVALDSQTRDLAQYLIHQWFKNENLNPDRYSFYFDASRLKDHDLLAMRGVTDKSIIFVNVDQSLPMFRAPAVSAAHLQQQYQQQQQQQQQYQYTHGRSHLSYDQSPPRASHPHITLATSSSSSSASSILPSPNSIPNIERASSRQYQQQRQQLQLQYHQQQQTQLQQDVRERYHHFHNQQNQFQ